MNRPLLLALTLTLAACGGGGTAADGGALDVGSATDGGPSIPFAASCAPFTPCGGSLAGTWTLSGGCLGGPPVASCPSATVSGQAHVNQLTFTDTNGFAMLAENVHFSVVVDFPTSCGPCTTSTLQGSYHDYFTAALTYFPNTCQTDASDATRCRCSLELSNGADWGGPDTATAGALTLTSGHQSGQLEYCVEGSTLTLHDVDAGVPFTEGGLLTFTR